MNASSVGDKQRRFLIGRGKLRLEKKNRHRRRTRVSRIEQLEARQMLIGSGWNNVLNPLNTTGDKGGFVAPNDVLVVVNEINGPRVSDPISGKLKVVGEGGFSPPPYHDVNCDTYVSPSDVLQIVNFLNGTRPRPGWTFDESGGSGDGAGSFSNEACAPLLREGNSLITSLVSNFVVPEGATAISFEYDSLSFDTTSQGSIRDAFEATLLDKSGRAAVHALRIGGDSFFNISEGLDASLTSDATQTGNKVSLSLAGVLPGTEAQLVVRLVNNDGDTETSVLIKSLQIEFAPLGGKGLRGNATSAGGVNAAAGSGSNTSQSTGSANVLGATQHTTLTPPRGAIPGRAPTADARDAQSPDALDPTTNDSGSLHGEGNTGTVIDNRGTEFWIGFPDSLHEQNNHPQKTLHITGNVATTGFVEIPGLIDPSTNEAFRADFAVNPGETTFVNLPSEDPNDTTDDQTDFDVEAELIAQIQQLGIHVVADDPITVYGVNRSIYSSDAFLALPVDALGTEYLNLSYENTFVLFAYAKGTQFLVVAPEDNTSVTISPGSRSARTPNSQAEIARPSANVGFGFDNLTNNSGGDIGPMVLDDSGTYTMTVKPPHPGFAGEYRFEVVDFESVATALNIAESATVSFPTGREARVLSFYAAAGQRLYFDPFVSQLPFTNAMVRLVSPSGNQTNLNAEVDSNPLTSTSALQMSESGKYYLLVVGDKDTTFEFSIRLMDVDAAPTLPLNVDVADTLDAVGQTDIYQFDGTVGQTLFFDSRSSNFRVWARFCGPGGAQLFSGPAEADGGPIQLPETGMYFVVVEGNNNAGTADYRFRLQDTAAVENLVSGTTVNNDFSMGQTRLYTLDSTGAQQAIITVKSASNPGGTNVDVFDPGGERIARSSLSSDFTIPMNLAGRYVIAVSGVTFGDSGSYAITPMVTTNSPVTKSGFNTTETLTINAGEEVSYQFSGPAGTPVLIDALDTASENLRIELTDPDGSVIFNANELQDIPTSGDPGFLPKSGTYTLTLRGNTANDSGSYSFRVLDFSTFARPIGLDAIVTDSLATGREALVYSFSGAAGQVLNFNGLEGSTPLRRVYDSYLRPIRLSGILDNAPDSDGLFRLLDSAVHYIVIRGNESNPSTFGFQVQDADAAATINLGQRVSGTLSPGRSQAVFRIDLLAGQTIYIDSLDDDSEIGYIRIRRPGLSTQFHFGVTNRFGDTSSQLLKVPESGEYFITIEGGADIDTDFEFQIIDVEAATPLAFDTDTNVRLTAGHQATFFRFDGRAAQDLFLDNVTANQAFFDWRLFNSAGRHVGGSFSGQDITTRTLTDGEYYLGILGSNDTPLNLTFRATRTSHPPVTPAGFNTEVTFSIPINGLGTYTFDSPAGRFVYLNVIKSTFLIPEHTVVLNQGETYLLRDEDSSADLTGTVITSDKPVAVFGGNQCSFVPTFHYACDHLLEQLPPTNTWGREFVTMPLKTNTTVGDRFRFLAQADGTEVTLNGEVVATLDRGEFHEQVIVDPSHIVSNGPILVAQFAHSQDFYRHSNGGDPSFSGDPFMVYIPPFEQFLSSYTVSTPAEDSIPEEHRFDRNFINLLAPDEIVGQISLGGVGIDASEFTPIGDSGFSGASVAIDLGSHRLVGALPFGVFVYGFGNFDSYGYTGGQALSPVANVASVTLNPETANPNVNSSQTFTAVVADASHAPVQGIRVDFDVAGANPQRGFGFSNDFGQVQFSYIGTTDGRDVVTASVGQVLDDSIVDWRTDAAPPQITVVSPTDGSVVPAGTTLVASGFALADFPNATIDMITVNGIPLDRVDAAGNFFVSLFVGPGDQEYEFTAIDSNNMSSSQRLTLRGTQLNPLQVDFTQFADVTGSFNAAYARTSYNTRRSSLHAETAVENIGQFPADAPLLVAIANISDPMVLVREADGKTPDGLPYYDFTGLVTGGSLDPRGETGFLSAAFYNPNQTQFTYDLLFFCKLNEPPQFTSLPTTTADLTREYTYQAGGFDPNGETVSFKLLAGPAAMTIDAASGLIRWTPGAGDAGVHSVEVQIADERLGVSTQRFSITARPTPANRAPVFTSLPLDTAEVGQDYPYAAVAVDADGDTLSYSLVSGPSGMAVHAGSGQISWIPTAQQLGKQAVVVEVVDSRGGAALHAYSLLVISPPDNLAPIIVNSPLAAVKLGAMTHQVRALDGDGETLMYRLLDGPAGMAIDASGLITWSSTVANLGAHQVSVQVLDTRGGADTRNFMLAVFDNQDPTITSQPVVDAQVGNTYSYQVNSSDSVDDMLSYKLLEAPPGMAIDSASGLISWDVTDAAYERERVTVGVMDGRGGSVQQQFTIDVTGGESLARNVNPFFVSAAPTVAVVGKKLLYAAKARDPNGDPLSYDLPLAPDGMVIDPLTGQLGWQPRVEQTGLQQVVIRVRDGTNAGIGLQSIQIKVNAANTAPVITSSPVLDAAVGRPWEYRVKVQDADSDPLTFELVSAPVGMTVTMLNRSDADAVVAFTPAASKTSEVTLRVSDGAGEVHEQRFQLSSHDIVANVAPVFTSNPRPTIPATHPWLYLIDVSDPNGDPVAISLEHAPAGMTLDANMRVVRWDPTTTQIGTHSVSLLFDDGQGGQSTQDFDVEVTADDIRRQPQIVSPPPAYRATVGKQFAYDLRAADPDGDPVEWTIVEAPVGSSIDRRSGRLRWTPTLDQLGSQRFVISAVDPTGQQGLQSFTLIVSAGNLAPQILSVAPSEAVAGERYVYGVRANVSGVFSLTTGPNGMTIDAARGIVRWTPTTSQLGTSTATVEVTDSDGNATSQTFTIEVTEVIRNQPPVINSRAVYHARVDAVYRYDVDATDPEAEVITYSLVRSPVGMLIDAQTGLITWTPTAAQAGAQLVHVVAIDVSGNPSMQRFAIHARANQGPTITSQAQTTVAVGGLYRYDIQVDDPEDDPLTYELLVKPTGMSIDQQGRILWPTEIGVQASNQVVVKVTDAFGASSLQTYAIEVTPDTTAPVVNIQLRANPLAVGGNALVIVQASDDVGLADVTLTRDGVPLVLDDNNSVTLRGDTAGLFELQAVARDTSGNETSAKVNFRVFDPADTGGPIISITSPQPNAIVTTLTDITGSVTDDNLEFYRVDYARADLVDTNDPFADDPDYKTLTTSNAEAFDKVLATFDPTILNNDDYVIRILAQDLSQNISAQTLTLGLGGQLKLGQFELDFTDLSIPLAGIPITVTRSYDTRDASESGDFGHGWSLAVQDAGILETVPEGSEFVPGKTKVYLTNPDGRRVGFTYDEEPISPFSIWADRLFKPVFLPDPGVNDTLQADIGDVARGGLSTLLNSIFRTLGVAGTLVNPSVYTLTTPSGLKYRYHEDDGLQTITDRNGNEVTFGEDGIQHSSGVSIDFFRDPRGRISRITDPTGNSIGYSYDLAGNLVKVTNQSDLETRYDYLPNPAHYLDQAFDSLGRRQLKVVYEKNPSSGQPEFKGVLDAGGNRIDDRVFDTEKNMAVVRDGNGNATTLLYDDRGNVLEEIDPLGNKTIYRYEDVRNPDLETTITDRLGNVTKRAYDQRGNLVSITEPGGGTRTATYDEFNNLTRVTDELGRVTTAIYDTSGNLVELIDAAGHRLTQSFDAAGRVVAQTDRNGNTTTFEYTSGDQPTRVTFADGTYQLFAYNHFGQATLHEFYEADGILVERSEAKYDDVGRVVQETAGVVADIGPPPTIVRRFYEGHLLDYEVHVHPDSLGLNGKLFESPSTPVEQRRSRITDFEYGENDRLIRQIDPAGGVVEFRYDANGNRVLLQDPVGNITTWVYDPLNRIEEERDPFFNSGLTIVEALSLLQLPSGADCDSNAAAAHVTLNCYDAEGNRSKTIDRNARRREFDYDFASRLLAEDWFNPDGSHARTLSFAYDAVGNMLTSSDPDSHEVFTYDTLNRLTSADNPDGSRPNPHVVLTYVYDGEGNVARTADNFGVTVESEYDQRNRLKTRTWFDADVGPGEVADVDPVRVDFLYNAADRQVQVTRFADLEANQLVARTTRTYDLAGRSDLLTHRDSADNVLAGYDYDYDFFGLLTNEERTHQDAQFAQNIEYKYDPTGQLIDALFSHQSDEHYEYDANGNRTLSRVGNVERVYTSGTANQLLSDGDFEYEYDGEGNLILKREIATGNTTEYDYDHRNRMTRVVVKSPGGIILNEVEFVYDTQNRRIAKIVNGKAIYSVNEGQHVWADFNAAGEVVAGYLYSDRIDQILARSLTTQGKAWHLADQLGSVRDVVDNSGAIVNHVEYGSFGYVIDQTGLLADERFLFTGREFDSNLDTYYYRARSFNPLIGRFNSVDPSGFEAGDANLYRYVFNRPLAFTDPTGLFAVGFILLYLDTLASIYETIDAINLLRDPSVACDDIQGINRPTSSLFNPYIVARIHCEARQILERASELINSL